MTADISANIFDPRQNYVSVRLQQGRVITDLDWNENERIEAHHRRRLLAELICGHGSTNDGFRPLSALAASVAVPSGGDGTIPRATYDVQLAAGSFLLGGHLHDWPAANTQTLLAQDDWLQLDGADRARLPSLPAAARSDLLYLEAFEQPVSAVEDRELRERALGGPDTSTRMRAMRRVAVLEDVPADCVDAAAALRVALTAPGTGDTSGVPHDFDDTLCELRSKARLSVDFTGPGAVRDPCKPRVTQGYLGAENQAIRVQLTAADRFLWAYDNAAPLYRVQVSDETPGVDGSIELTLLTPPRDPVLFPMQDMVAEILPWGTVLANREKVADRTGPLARVTSAYDPADGTLRIAPALPLEMLEWLRSPDRDDILSPPERDPEDERRYFYLRLWQPGPSESAALEHEFTPASAVELPDTGLTVSFSAPGIAGDYWVIAARPNTPDLVVPWRLLETAAPFGPQRFYAPLGLVRWRLGVDGEPVARIEDCRHRFRKLCQVESCCTVHVGDGHHSHGEVNDLQAAIDLLPDEGGRICLLPGTHEAAVTILRRRDLVIEGCGPRSVLVPAAGQTAPLVGISRCENITLRSLAMHSLTTRLVVAESVRGLRLDTLQLRARDRAAVLGGPMEGAELVDSVIRVDALAEFPRARGPGAEPAVFLAGRGLRVLRNRILTAAGGRSGQTPQGGLQIGGDSEDVVIADNLVEGGNGAGIVLGSIDYQPGSAMKLEEGLREHYGRRLSRPDWTAWTRLSVNDCITLDPRPRPLDDPDRPEPLVPVSDGPVVDCRIAGNRIVSMGASGITVAFWFDPAMEEDAIVTDRLLIEGNEIRDCMRLPASDLDPTLLDVVAFGGVTLAAGADITLRDNRIVEVGTGHGSPIVGIYILDGEAVTIERNHLRDNGRIAGLTSPIMAGRTGGIVLALVRPGVDFLAPFGRQLQARQDGAPAVIVTGNVVSAREGRALTVFGVGPMVIHGNQLTAHGSNFLGRFLVTGAKAGGVNVGASAEIRASARAEVANPLMAFLDVLGGAAVAVLNLGVSNEIYLQLLGFSGLGLVEAQQPPDSAGFDDDIKLLANGNVQFNDNQVVLDGTSLAVTLTLSSVLLISLDDVSIEDNQSDCDMLLDFVAVNTLALGWSVRMQGNRCKESFATTFLSGLTLGLMNDTSHNQGTHCFTHWGLFEPRIGLTNAPAGFEAELDTNRHLVPARFCGPFNDKRTSLATGAGFTTLGL